MIWFQHGEHACWLFKLAVIGFIFLAGSIFLAQRAVRNRGIRVLVYPEGLVRLQRMRPGGVLGGHRHGLPEEAERGLGSPVTG